jgi:hypothetical protein
LLGDQSRFTAKRRNHINLPTFPFRTKGDLPAVWRERRLALVGFVMGETERLAASDLLHPNVEVSFPAAVGGIGQ